MWYESTSLCEMQRDITNIFGEKMRLHKKVSEIIDLSYEDYMLMTNRLKNIHSAEEIDHYSLSLLVGWVSSYKFKHQDDYYREMKKMVSTMPQHHTRYLLESINTTCYDYQIDLFKIPVDSLKAIRDISKIHAGF